MPSCHPLRVLWVGLQKQAAVQTAAWLEGLLLRPRHRLPCLLCPPPAAPLQYRCLAAFADGRHRG